MQKYRSVVEKINEFVTEFNNLLKSEYHINPLDIDKLENDAYFLRVNGENWATTPYPRCGGPGIYFYMATPNDNGDQVALYIGKASNKSTIGDRLHSYFHWRTKQGNFEEEGKDGSIYTIELITSIPIENTETVFLAPALEEFLICKFAKLGQFALFNKHGTNC